MVKEINKEVSNYTVKVVKVETIKNVVLGYESAITGVIRNVEDGAKQQKLVLTYLSVTSSGDSKAAMRLIKYEDGRMVLFDHIAKVKYTNAKEFAVSTADEFKQVTEEAFS